MTAGSNTVGKIAMSLSPDLLARIDDYCHRRGSSRSGLSRRPTIRLLDEELHRAKVKRDAEGYGRDPQTGRDVEEAESLIGEAWAEPGW